MDTSVRWQHRFQNYERALKKLREAVESLDLTVEKEAILSQMSELEREGLIQRFEYTHELAWKVMKDYLEFQGIEDIGGSRDAIRGANQLKLIDHADVWMEMIAGRNATSHTYDEVVAENIFIKIVITFYPLLESFEEMMIFKKNTIV